MADDDGMTFEEALRAYVGALDNPPRGVDAAAIFAREMDIDLTKPPLPLDDCLAAWSIAIASGHQLAPIHATLLAVRILFEKTEPCGFLRDPLAMVGKVASGLGNDEAAACIEETRRAVDSLGSPDDIMRRVREHFGGE